MKNNKYLILISISTSIIIACCSIFMVFNGDGFTNKPIDLSYLQDGETIKVRHNETNKIADLKIAKKPDSIENGLMNITYLQENTGMLFLFENEQIRSFWMKNTLISLDIIYLDQDFKVVDYFDNTKPNQIVEIYTSSNPAKFVIEVDSTWSNEDEITIGSLFSIE